MPKKKRKMIIILIITFILLLLLLAGGVCAYLYINTDMLKSNQTLFEKYLAQNFSIAKEYLEINPTELQNTLNQNKYTSNITVKATYTSGKGTSEENKDNSINKATLNINSQIDKTNNYDYKDIRLAYDTEDVAKLEYINSNDLKGIRLDGIKQFVSIKNEDIEKVAGNLGIESQYLKTAWAITQGLNIKEIFNFTEEEIKNLQTTYSDIIKENTNKDSYGKYSDATITLNNTQTTANGYYIELTKEQYYSLLIKVLEKLSTDEIILGKIDNIENTAKEYGVNSEETYRDMYVNYINNYIEEIKGKSIGNETFRVSVYEQNGQTVKTTIETDEGSLNIDIYNDKTSIKIDKIDTTETVQKRQTLNINQNITNTSEKVELEYMNYENGVEQTSLKISNNKEMQNNNIKGSTSIAYEIENSKIEIKADDYIKIVNEFDNPIELSDENNVTLNNLNQEQTQNILNILSQNVNDKKEKTTEKITADDINSMLKDFGFIKEDVIKEQAPVEVTETERNRFNSNLTLFIGEQRSTDDITRLLETIQGDLKDAQITNDEKDKLQEITLDIERGANNTEKKDEVTQVLNENKSKKFNITMSYDEDTKLINKIFFKIPET